MYSSEIHFPLLISDWNNLDQLSSLWATFTKCKSDITDGFRLENLSWRLWYRHSVLQKKPIPNAVHDIDLHHTPQLTLRRTRSLPNIQLYQQPKRSRKFFIGDDVSVKKPVLRRASTAPKPVSIPDSFTKPKSLTDSKHTGLRRCQSRYIRLDQLISNTA